MGACLWNGCILENWANLDIPWECGLLCDTETAWQGSCVYTTRLFFRSWCRHFVCQEIGFGWHRHAYNHKCANLWQTRILRYSSNKSGWKLVKNMWKSIPTVRNWWPLGTCTLSVHIHFWEWSPRGITALRAHHIWAGYICLNRMKKLLKNRWSESSSCCMHSQNWNISCIKSDGLFH